MSDIGLIETPYIIRPLEREDQRGARTLILAGLRERWKSFDPSLNADLDDIAASYKDGLFLVAVHRGEIIGCGGLLPVDEESGQIVRMSTAAAWRKRGVATQLLANLEEAARQKGLNRLILETTSSWENAVRFYQKKGYRITHSEEADIFFAKQLDER